MAYTLASVLITSLKVIERDKDNLILTIISAATPVESAPATSQDGIEYLYLKC